MYCPNCNKESEGKFCQDCGARLIEKPSAGGFNINLGDANAISGGVNLHDSHNVHNEDKSVHNISNVSNVTNNVTNVAAQKTEMELLQEKKTLYLNECKRAYEDNVLEQSEIIALEEYRIKIGLDKVTADSILDSVRIMTERNARKTSLNPIAKTKLKILTDNLRKNEVKALMDQIDGLEALVNKYEHDELSRKYFLVLAALKPEKCIGLKENSKIDSYWKSFWSYLAYIKADKNAEAENVLVSLDRFADYPEDNMTVLAVAGALMNGNNAEAKEYLNSVTGDYTPALQRFVDSIYLLLDPEMAKEMGADDNTCAFYLVNFFTQEDPKERARKEAEVAMIKLKAEEEARIKAEQEAKAKAEEEARIKAEQEAKAKAEEEARIKAEQEAKAKAEEEARIKAEQEAKAKAEEEARIKAEQEAKAEQKATKKKNNNDFPETIHTSDNKYFEGCSELKLKNEFKDKVKHIVVDRVYYQLTIRDCSVTKITIGKRCRLKLIDNKNLTTIIGDDVESIYISGCDKLECSIEDGIKYYRTWAIEVIDKYKLKSTYQLRENTTILGESLFHSTRLRNIVIPNQVKIISDFAFTSTMLTSVTIPSSVELIGVGAFSHYDKNPLKEIHIKCKSVPNTAHNAFDLKSLTFYVPTESLDKYKKKDAYKGGFFSGVKIIGE